VTVRILDARHFDFAGEPEEPVSPRQIGGRDEAMLPEQVKAIRILIPEYVCCGM
jgi:hypothetical protein